MKTEQLIAMSKELERNLKELIKTFLQSKPVMGVVIDGMLVKNDFTDKRFINIKKIFIC